MELIKEQILNTWKKNQNITIMLFDAVPDDAWDFTTSKRGGGKISHQFKHLYNLRYWKTERAAKDLIIDFGSVKKMDALSRTDVRALLEESGAWITEIIERSCESNFEVKGDKDGIISFLGYFMTHEAHHRGNIILSLKLGGFKREKILQYGIWNWGKLIP